MARADKLLLGMANNPTGDWTIENVQTVCASAGIQCLPPKRGGHFKVVHPSQVQILTIPADRPIRPVYIRKLVAFIDQVRESEDGGV